MTHGISPKNEHHKATKGRDKGVAPSVSHDNGDPDSRAKGKASRHKELLNRGGEPSVRREVIEVHRHHDGACKARREPKKARPHEEPWKARVPHIVNRRDDQR